MTTEREMLAEGIVEAIVLSAEITPDRVTSLAVVAADAILASDWLTAHTAAKVNAAVEAAAVRVEDGCTHSMHHGPCARCQDAARAVRGDS